MVGEEKKGLGEEKARNTKAFSCQARNQHRQVRPVPEKVFFTPFYYRLLIVFAQAKPTVFVDLVKISRFYLSELIKLNFWQWIVRAKIALRV